MSCEPQASKIVWDGTTLTYLARVVGVAQVAITQASVTSITRTMIVTETDTTGTPTTLVKTDVIFNTLQTDYGWDKDTTGYNLRDIISPITGQDVTVRLKYDIVDSDGRHLIWCRDVFVRKII